MSSPSKEDLLKSGHFPAKIAGGMRVAQREKKNSEKEVADESNTSYDEIDGNINDVDCKQTNNILASTGLAAKVNNFFFFLKITLFFIFFI